MNAQLNLQSDADLDISKLMQQVGQQAIRAKQVIAAATTEQKNLALSAIAETLLAHEADILAANQQDMQRAREQQIDAALLDRLELNHDRVQAMAAGVQQIVTLVDPVGEMLDLRLMPSGIQVGKMRVPLGVIGIIYESRPNVTIDAAALCLKSGNAAILRGGSEALQSNLAIAECIQTGLEKAGLPAAVVQVVTTADRAAVGELITMSDVVDVIVPRGGKGLIERISQQSTVPVIKHLDGVCHVYIDKAADNTMAIKIAVNAKTHRYGVCNAMETLLIHQDKVHDLMPGLIQQYQQKGVELRGDERLVQQFEALQPATEADWATEYLAPILSIKAVDDIDAAIQHIARYGSHHTDAIVTQDYSQAQKFLREVDSSSVMVNASTRFADGFEYGLGAEIGISTDKLHVRGPVGLEGLTTLKNIVFGHGEIRS